MGNPALSQTAIRYGLNPAAAKGMNDDQLRNFISIRQSHKAAIKPPKPKPVKPKKAPKVALPPIFGPTVKGHGKNVRLVGSDPISQAVEANRPENRRQRDRQRQETIRRQQILKSQGFNVVVDGVWGARSQAAWNRFSKHHPAPILVNKPGAPRNLPFTDPAAETKRKQQLFHQQQEKEQQKAERDQAINDRKAAHFADVKLANQRAAIIKQAKALRDNPRLASKMTLKQLTAVLTDKETGFDLATSNAAAQAIQYHLRAHGYNVRITGRPDVQTFNTLKLAFRDQDRRETKKRLNAIHDQVYAPLRLKPGQTLKGFPGTVPTMAELDKIIQTGGPRANQIMRYLNTHVVTSYDAWDAARWRQLEFIADKRHPGFKKQHPHASHQQILAALAAPFDYTGGAKGNEAKLNQFKGETVWDSQLKAVLTSRDPAQMKRKLVAYDRLNEQKFKNKQAELAKHHGFWGEAFDKLTSEAQWTFTGATLATTRIIQEGARFTGQDFGERTVRWEDAQIMLGYAKPGDFANYDDLAHRQSRWLTIPGSLVVDPLNFVAPFKAASTLARFGRGASSLGRYGIEGEGILGKTLVYTKGTWSKAELARQIPGVTSLEATRSGQAAVSFGKKLVQDKEKALAMVRGRVAQAARHGFDPFNQFAKKAIKSKRPTNLAEIQANKRVVRAWIEDPNNPELQGLIKELKDASASLYVDAARSTMSNVGASVLANWAEKIRVLAAHQFGTDQIVKMINDSGFEQVKADADAAYAAYRKGTGTLADAQAAGAKRKQLADEIVNAYKDTVDNAGTYIAGGALKDDGHLLGKSILSRTLEKMDAIEDSILPTIQDIIETHAEEMFAAAKMAKAAEMPPLQEAARDVFKPGAFKDDVAHPLWDKNGLWVSRNGEEAAALRARSRAAFDEENLATVPNPAYGIGHTMAEMADAIQFEVRRGLPRIYNFAHREAMRLGSEFKFDAEAAAINLEKDIRHSWEQRPDNLWYDNRPGIKVNKLYARNFKDVADSFLGDLANYVSGSGELDLPGLERIAAYGPTGVVDGMDDAANGMLWQLGSRVKKMPGFEQQLGAETTRVRHVPGPPPGYVIGANAKADWYQGEFQRLSEFSSALSKYRVSLTKGADEILPSELSKDLLFMRALAVHQAKWAKATYLALNGFLKIWKFATLPLRPGWVVRNTVDNFAKAMVRSVRDPRFLLLGGENPGAASRAAYDAVHTVFDLGVTPLREAVRFFDGLFNTKALDEFDRMLEIFWNYPPEILSKFFDLAALPAPPQSVLDSSRFSRQLDDWRTGNRAPVNVSLSDYANAEVKPPLRLQKAEDKRAYEQMMMYGDPTAAQRLAYKMRKTPEVLWDLMGNRPENYFKRVIYRAELKKEMVRLEREGITGVDAQMLAHEKAWDVVNETLFDYSKMSVVEDNLRVFMPFIQFWRKNTVFWMQTGVSKPWLPLSVLKLDQQRREAHDDLPEWMQRYFHVNEIVDAAAVVPGLDVIVEAILPNNMMTDPTSFLSFAPLHKVFRDFAYGENQFLPPEDRGHGIASRIITPIITAMDEWGLGINPIVRKPMEVAGIIDSRDWQAVFPQTTLAEAFTLKFWGEDAMFRVAQWERVFTLGDDVHADKIAQNFDFYVNREMAQQMIRGEPVDRATAEATVKATIWTQAMWAYFGGTFWRHASPEDIYIAKLQDDLHKGRIDYENLPAKTKSILSVWSRATGGAEQFDRYLKMIPQIQAFYKEPDFNERAEMIKTYPALSEYVDMKPTARTIGSNWMKNAQRYTDTARYFKAVEFATAIDATSMEKQIAFKMFVTPALEKFWAKNDTPAQIKARMVKGEIYRHMKDLQDAYFKIPDTDFEAKNGFLEAHPELSRWWQSHNDPTDNYEAIMGGVKADLRNLYFEVVKTRGFAAAAPILKQFPFMFEGTKSEKKIKDGVWITGYGKKGWDSARRNAWMAVANYAHNFFNNVMKQMGSQKAFDWLHEQAKTDPQARALLAYFARYGHHHARSGASKNWSPERLAHWKKVAKFARWFFDFYLPRVGEDAAWTWLRKQTGAEARQFMAYIDKYSTKEGKGKFSPERRAAYLDVKDFMNWFFDSYMPKVGEKRAWEWLRNSNDPQARAMVDYLAKYGKHSRKSLDYKKAKPWLTHYFDLPEDQRQAWLNGGSEGARIVRWYFDKYATEHDMTQHGKDYKAVQADLKVYFALPKEQRTAWLNSGSPQAARVLAYFKKYGKAHQYEREFKKLVTEFPALSHGTPEQARRIQFWQRYFALTPDQRPAFVLKNAEAYGIFIYGDLSEGIRFDQEAEYDRRAVGLGISNRAADFLYVRPLLTYYETLGKDEKQLFLRANPELQDYFDKYSTYSPTGDKTLDALVERYFLMPEDSALRSQMLRQHPELQDYFDAKASPALKAMRAVLEQYFGIKNPNQRRDYLRLHPEIRDYFDARKAERGAEAAQLAAFEQADPRLKPYFKSNQDMRRSADMMARKLHHAAISAMEESTSELQLRRERQPVG